MIASTPVQHATAYVVVRAAEDRGVTRLSWLDSRHAFSFGGYVDRAHAGFRSLRVINEDRVAKGGGFPQHGHADMEIFSYVVSGSLAHQDSMGNERVLRPGEIQLMSAGDGVEHSEFNGSNTEETHFLQMWILPAERGLEPRYTEWKPTAGTADTSKVLVISPDGRDGSALIRQDAHAFRLRMAGGETVHHELRPGRGAWLQVISGSVLLEGVALGPGDGGSTERGGTLTIEAKDDVHALLFDLE